ncbi:uncharacterized protein LOC128387718 isoform X2 [Panonychus citri]|nr:uncharacterized protein LOC128387718 isoform X2 [Panonychus citri]
MAVAKSASNSSIIKYIYDLPYHVRKSLCDLLDADGSWRQLGGQYMEINDTQLTLISHAILRNGSPTNDLLVRWEQTNGQVRNLFKYLHDMGHRRAMIILAPHVDLKLRQICLGSSDADDEDDLTFYGKNILPIGVNSVNDNQLQSINNDIDNMGNNYIGAVRSATNQSRGLINNDNEINENNTNGPLVTHRYNPPGKSKGIAIESNYRDGEKSHQQIAGNVGIVDNDKRIHHLHHHHHPTAPTPSYSMEQKIVNQGRWNDLSVESAAIAAVPVNPVREEPSKQINLPANAKRSNYRDKSISVTPSVTSNSEDDFLEGLEIPYKELLISTDDFSKDRIIGRGGFGVVYKGIWKGTEVAIKKLKSVNSMHQAKIELRALNQYRIDNILPLYGISLDGPEACLLYQYMPNGSLEDRLLCKGNTFPLTWDQRASIGEGLAKALNFLHTLRGKPLVHGDVKSANVLLDSQYQCKLGDFGLARQIMSSKSGGNYTHLTVTSVHGTCVYLPPEYLRNKMLSPAVDVFSYGIVMLEMATGRRAYDGKRLLLELVQEEFAASQLDESRKDCIRLKDPRMGLTVEENHWFTNLIRLGLDCANKMIKKRPLMGQVLEYYDQTKTRERIRRLSAGSANGGSSIISELKTPLELKLYYEMTRETNQQLEENNHQQPTGSTVYPIENSTDRSTVFSSVRQTVSSVGYNDLAQEDVSIQHHDTGNEIIPLLTELGIGDENTINASSENY